MEDIYKAWLISRDPNIVTTWRILKHPAKMGEILKSFIVLGLQGKDLFLSGLLSTLAIHVRESSAKPKKKNGSQHKLSTTYPHPLMILHWNVYPAWKDRGSTKNYRYWLTKVQGWIPHRHCLLREVMCLLIRMPFYIASLENLVEWQGFGERERKVKKHSQVCW